MGGEEERGQFSPLSPSMRRSTYYVILKGFWEGLNLNCIDVYAALEWANNTKLHILATKHKAITYTEHLIHFNYYALNMPHKTEETFVDAVQK